MQSLLGLRELMETEKHGSGAWHLVYHFLLVRTAAEWWYSAVHSSPRHWMKMIGHFTPWPLYSRETDPDRRLEEPTASLDAL
jgi:hypothetical protein